MINSVGPYSSRKPTQVAPAWEEYKQINAVKNMLGGVRQQGLVEWLQVCLANNPNASFVICIGPIIYTPQECRNLVNFLLDDPKESSWGALRAQCGIEKPVNVEYIEVGQESAVHVGVNGTEEDSQLLINTFVEQAKAMKEEHPELKLIACGPHNLWAPKVEPVWREYNFRLAPLLPYVDAISHHPYYDGYSSELMMRYADEMKEDIDKIVKDNDIRDENGNLKDIKVFSTEHARYWDPADKIPASVNFTSALSVSHFLNLSFRKPYMAGAAVHNLVESHMWAFWEEFDGEFYESPTAKLYQLYNDSLGDVIYDSEYIPADEEEFKTNPLNKTGSGEPKNDRFDFSAFATPISKNELNLILTNKQANTDIDMIFQFNNNYTLVKETILSAPNEATFAFSKTSEALTTITSTEKNVPNFSSYRMPNMSVVVLTLKTNSTLPLSPEQVKTGYEGIDSIDEITENVFEDTEYYWANREISKMASLGFVSGTSDTAFEPDKNITKGEAAAVIARMLKLKTDYKGSFYTDVKKDDWYSGYANACYAEGIVRSNIFNADSEVTTADLCGLVDKIYRKYKTVDETIDYDAVVNSLYASSGITESNKKQIAFAIHKGILNRLYETRELQAEKPVTRGEAVCILYNLYQCIMQEVDHE